uniref:SWI/SNF-like complex subunit BAF250 C-terminal domain-containing protein n=2 Tax=Chenopodium quinoa TaxID=63459 RepID=A0A803MSW0_CHEQI
DSAAPHTLLGPTLQVHSAFADQNQKRIVLALQSGLKSDLTWALNTLTVLSFKEKDEIRKDATPLTKIPGLLDALLQIIDDWRDIALPKDLSRNRRLRLLGANALVTGFGNEYEALASSDNYSQSIAAPGSYSSQKITTRHRPTGWWFEEDGLFNLDDDGLAEKQLCAVAASNILRNFSFMYENEIIMAQHRHCLETVFQCIEDQNTEDEELVTNALETIVNLGPYLDLRIFSSSKPSYINMTEKSAVQAIMGMLDSQIKAWHCAAAELLGRLIINPDNETFLLSFATQIYKRLVDLLSLPAVDAQAAAVGALYNLVEVNMDCRLNLASERWAIDRLLKVVKAPHPVPEICRKAATILESLVSEPQNRVPLLAYENAFAEILFSESKHADTFARILYELTSRPNNKQGSARGVWGL